MGITVVPEPSTFVLAGIGIILISRTWQRTLNPIRFKNGEFARHDQFEIER
jgi:hypothetical protein